MTSEVLQTYRNFADWLETLYSMDERAWSEPIAEGKWGIREIVAHILFWDRNFLTDRLPVIAPGAVLISIDAETVNHSAAEYARTISIDELLDETIQTRRVLCDKLNSTPEAVRSAAFSIETSPFTLTEYVQHMTEHDEHHHAQMRDFLAAQTH